MQWIVKTYNHLKWTSNTYKLTSCSTRRRTYSLEVTNHAHFFSSKETITQRGAKDVYFFWNEGSDWSMAKILFGLSMLNSQCLMDFFSYTFQHVRCPKLLHEKGGRIEHVDLSLEDNLNIGQIVLHTGPVVWWKIIMFIFTKNTLVW